MSWAFAGNRAFAGVILQGAFRPLTPEDIFIKRKGQKALLTRPVSKDQSHQPRLCDLAKEKP